MTANNYTVKYAGFPIGRELWVNRAWHLQRGKPDQFKSTRVNKHYC